MEILSVAATDPLLNQLRPQYLAYLYEPQDLYSESLNKDATRHILWEEGEAVGYCLTADQGMLLEFYLMDERLAESVFEHVLHAQSITRAMCKTFDPLFLSLCLAHAVQTKPIALHFTTIADVDFQENKSVAVRLAEVTDLASIKAINDGFFDSDEEVCTYIQKGHLMLYEDKGGLIGCGLVQPVVAGQPYYDLGMLVNPSRRRQGIGQYIVRHLKAHCLSQGLRPICCCDIGNVASRACLEAAGFRSRHRTVEFCF